MLSASLTTSLRSSPALSIAAVGGVGCKPCAFVKGQDGQQRAVAKVPLRQPKFPLAGYRTIPTSPPPHTVPPFSTSSPPPRADRAPSTPSQVVWTCGVKNRLYFCLELNLLIYRMQI